MGLKEPAKRQAMAQESSTYNSSVWEAGMQKAKIEITSVQQVGK
jgi:hypothetical protein